MITKKELMLRICDLEARIDSLAGSCKRMQIKLNKLEKPEEKKTSKKVVKKAK